MAYNRESLTSHHVTSASMLWGLTQIGYVLLSLVIGVALVWVIRSTATGLHLYLQDPGVAQKASWYTMRAAGLTSYTLLWLSTLMGLLVSARWLPKRARTLVSWHEFASLVSLVFLSWHVIALYLDTYISVAWWQVWVPFSMGSYRPVAVAWGQISTYLMVAIIVSFYIRRYIGAKRWRQLHYMTLVLFGLALLHALTAGTDVIYTPVRLFYILTSMSILGLVYMRIFQQRSHRPSRQRKAQEA